MSLRFVGAFILLVAVASAAIYWISAQPRDDSDTDSVAETAETLGETEAAQAEYELPEEETEWLWELEHRGNVMSRYGFAKIRDALTTGGAADIQSLLHPEFVGEVHSDPAVIQFDSSSVQAVRYNEVKSREELSAEDFTSRLLQFRAELDTVSKCSIGTKRIGPVDSSDPEGLWRILCEVWIRGSAGQGLAEVTLLFSLDVMPPKKSMLEEDAWIRNWTIHDAAVATARRSLFTDVAAEVGINVESLHDNWQTERKLNNTGGVYLCDFNRDGFSDILVTDNNPVANSLYQGLPGGKFKDVTNTIGIGRVRQLSLSDGNALFADFDNDGWVDLYHTQGGLWKNINGERFEDWQSNSNLLSVADPRISKLTAVSVADFDRDGLLDLYFVRSRDVPESWLEPRGIGPDNILCRNLGNWQFEDVTADANVTGEGTINFTSAWLDANNDSWPDICLINEYGDSLLYINNQNGTFKARDMNEQTSDFGSMGLDVGDINNDGNIDVYVAGMYSKAGSRIIGNLRDDAFPAEVMHRLDSLIDGSELYVNNGDLSFSAEGKNQHVHNIGWSWGPTLADFNNDGWLDIYSPSGYMSRDRQKPDG